ncbi:urea carboxylase [Demequina aestuarii]|uniref:urea carboxylase n=1 Tax=Demequina aestuarii TaxID=327095 RepID=UPI0007827C8F|nr:urea carboxylase [Demequina aestuarii]
MAQTRSLSTVLIANRGEIARRLIRGTRAAGLRSVGIYTAVDSAAAHVREADQAIALSESGQGYLAADEIVAIALATGADAVHPGYGFLSENADFAVAVEAAGLAFIGPTPEQIRLFGSKAQAREVADRAGVPCVPGSGIVGSAAEAVAQAQRIGLPVMLKAVGGGGGVGVERCDDVASLEAAFEAVGALARRHFASGDVFVEKLIDDPRHVEVQIVGDGAGTVSVLGDRDCSLQRRHQKVVEEAPAPGLSRDLRTRLHDHARAVAAAVDYRSVGTVEFLVAGDDVYFLEANTRLQVEHAVTEEVTGVDLVGTMLGLAAGAPLLDDHSVTGHSIEVRLCAEDPFVDHRPSAGVLTEVVLPDGPGIRVESGVERGDVVTAHYDSLLAKIIVTAPTRDGALDLMREALAGTVIRGIETNIPLLKAAIEEPRVWSGDVSTGLLGTVDLIPQRIRVARAGMSTTLQDWPGRIGHWQVGVPPSGPFDDVSFRWANRIVGNPEGTTALEATMLGPVLEFSYDTVVAVTGAAAEVRVGGRSVPMWEPVSIEAGQSLEIATPASGARTYVATRGGFDAAEYLGSTSTFVPGGFGGHGGRELRAGDVLHPGAAREAASLVPTPHDRPAIDSEWVLHVAEGPQPAPEYFTPESIAALYEATWTVHVHAARTGVRLTGPQPAWARPDGGEAGLHPSNLHDNPYSVGAINFTGDTPSILGPDGPSLGGFACPFTVVSADRWKLGQLRPGDTVRLAPVDEPTLPQVREARRAAAPFEPSVTRRDDDHGVLARTPASADAPEVVYRRGGDDNLLLEYGPMELDLALRMRVHALMEAVERHRPPGLLDMTPGIRSLHFHVDADQLSVRSLHGLLAELEGELPDGADLTAPSREVVLPMSWDDPVVAEAIDRYQDLVRDDAPWNPSNLEFMRRINGLDTVEDVRRIVFDAEYLVLGLGDVYLGAPAATPVDPRHRLVTTKYNPARTWTAEGTVGIGGSYMCIYGMDSPGGYQLVGRTLPIWAGLREGRPSFEAGKPWLLRFFDRVRFVDVPADELEHLRREFVAGRMDVDITEGRFSLAEHQAFLAQEAGSIAEFRARQAQAFATERAQWEAAGEFDVQEAAADAPVAVTADVQVPPGCEIVEAPMAGSVWRVSAQAGDEVDSSGRIVVLEAMKMELPVAPRAHSHVIDILVRPGQVVSAGQAIAVVRPSAPSKENA